MTTEHADAWMRELVKKDFKESTKNHYQKSVKTLFKWQRNARNRDLTPYGIRHSTAIYVASEEGLAVVAEQCRHKSKRTTEKYEHSSIERQQDAVNSID